MYSRLSGPKYKLEQWNFIGIKYNLLELQYTFHTEIWGSLTPSKRNFYHSHQNTPLQPTWGRRRPRILFHAGDVWDFRRENNHWEPDRDYMADGWLIGTGILELQPLSAVTCARAHCRAKASFFPWLTLRKKLLYLNESTNSRETLHVTTKDINAYENIHEINIAQKKVHKVGNTLIYLYIAKVERTREKNIDAEKGKMMRSSTVCKVIKKEKIFWK